MKTASAIEDLLPEEQELLRQRLKVAAEPDKKKAVAFDLGVRRALFERGIPPGPRQELAVKVAMALSEGRIRQPHDTMVVVKEAVDGWADEDEGFHIGDWITEETKNLHPLAKFLLLAGGGTALGAGAGALGDKTMELFGRKPSSALTLLGALTGGGMGAYKHVSDAAGPLPQFEDRLALG